MLFIGHIEEDTQLVLNGKFLPYRVTERCAQVGPVTSVEVRPLTISGQSKCVVLYIGTYIVYVCQSIRVSAKPIPLALIAGAASQFFGIQHSCWRSVFLRRRSCLSLLVFTVKLCAICSDCE